MNLLQTWVRRRSRLLNNPWQPETPDLGNEAIGELGEELAATFLYAMGCKILYRNFTAPSGGEIDLTVRDGKVLAFVEVKTRTSAEFGRPALAVNLEKRMLIARGVRAWLQMLSGSPPGWRCDIVEVNLTPGAKPEIYWIRSAFTVEETRRKVARKFS
jgi:putative endonuclease